jgi:hypothetical protein
MRPHPRGFERPRHGRGVNSYLWPLRGPLADARLRKGARIAEVASAGTLSQLGPTVLPDPLERPARHAGDAVRRPRAGRQPDLASAIELTCPGSAWADTWGRGWRMRDVQRSSWSHWPSGTDGGWCRSARPSSRRRTRPATTLGEPPLDRRQGGGPAAAAPRPLLDASRGEPRRRTPGQSDASRSRRGTGRVRPGSGSPLLEDVLDRSQARAAPGRRGGAST